MAFWSYLYETEAKKTTNYDKYSQEIKSISDLIAEKRLAVENLLKQKDFASLKQKLEQYKQQKGI
jgi:hypothetical protein